MEVSIHLFISKRLLATAAILSLFALTGCSSGSTGTPASTQPVDTIKPGAANMLKALAELKVALTANDGAKAKTATEGVEAAWATFEEAVKAKDQAIYVQVEEPLGNLQAGTKESKLDTTLLKEQLTKLESVLTQLTK
jgi:hypothetical protein